MLRIQQDGDEYLVLEVRKLRPQVVAHYLGRRQRRPAPDAPADDLPCTLQNLVSRRRPVRPVASRMRSSANWLCWVLCDMICSGLVRAGLPGTGKARRSASSHRVSRRPQDASACNACSP
jgi:hypothetical protein